MMSKRMQRDLFLMLTVIGSFLSLSIIFLGVAVTEHSAHQIMTEITRRDTNALIAITKSMLPLSVLGGGVFVGTWVSYRRYQKLGFSSR